MSPTAAILSRLRGRGLTQAEIARRCGITQPKLSKWEGGAIPAGADDALKLAALEADLIAAEGATCARPCIDVAAPAEVRDAA